MKVTFRWQQKTALCCSCKLPVEKGEQAAWHYFSTEDGRRIGRCYHLACWLANMFRWFEDNPYQSNYKGGQARGRIDDETRKLRNTLGRKYHRLMMKKERLISLSQWDALEKVNIEINQVKAEMAETGKVPKWWV